MAEQSPAATFSDDQLSLLLDPTKDREWIEAFLNVPSEDVNAGIIHWKTTTQQSRILETTQKTRRLIIVKGRQTRCSTVLLAKALRHATTHFGQNYVVVTQTDKMTQNFRQFLKDRLKELGEVLGQEYSYATADGGVDNADKLRLGKMRSTFHFSSAEQKGGLRGINTAHWVHLSEVAHWPDKFARSLIGGLLPAAPAGGLFVAESTPNGAAGWFYEQVADSMPLVPQSLWTTAFYPWWLEETYTLGTYATMLADVGIDVDQMRASFIPSPAEESLMNKENLNIDKMLWRRLKTRDLLNTGQYFAQEYPEDLLSCWLAAGIGFFHDDQFDHLEYYRAGVKEPAMKMRTLPYVDPKTGIRSEMDFLGPNFLVWEPPIPGHKYCAFQDTSAGVSQEGDYSALVIVDTQNLRHVATLRVRTLPSRVGQMAAAACAYYAWAYLAVERNTYGLDAITRLQELHYPNLYYDFINNPDNPRLGWATEERSRESMLGHFRTAVFNHQFQTQDRMLLLEMGAFSWRKMQGRTGNIQFKAEADKGNDDMVIAMAGACEIAPYAPNRVNLGSSRQEFGQAAGRGIGIGMGLDMVDPSSGIVRRDEYGAGAGNLPWLSI